MRLKRMLSLLLALTLLCAMITACSKDPSSSSDDSSASDDTDTQPTDPDDDKPETDDGIAPMLWKISDDDNTVFFFGTIHVGDDRTAVMTELLEPYLEECSVVGLEIDNQAIEEDTELLFDITRSYLYTDGDTVDNHMREDLLQRSVKYLSENDSYNSYYMMCQLGFWVDLLELTAMDGLETLSMDYAMEERLTDYANEHGMSIDSIEDPLEHADISMSLSDDLNNLLIEEFFDDLDTYEESLLEVYELWLTGNKEEFGESMEEEDEDDEPMTEEEEALSEEYNQALLTNRNEIMANRAIEYLGGSKNVFFAVGAAHFFGDDSVISFLEKKGYTVESISVGEALPKAA